MHIETLWHTCRSDVSDDLVRVCIDAQSAGATVLRAASAAVPTTVARLASVTDAARATARASMVEVKMMEISGRRLMSERVCVECAATNAVQARTVERVVHAVFSNLASAYN